MRKLVDANVVLRYMLHDDEVQTKHPEALKSALQIFGLNKLDFVDCLLVAYNNNLGDKVASFDRKLNRLLQ